jgi:site-specific DNA-methyltransferase (adenine-specific)
VTSRPAFVLEELKKEGRMEIVYKKIGELKPYENNPRKNDEAVDAVAASISEFGWKVPVVIDADNVIVAGHTRYKAAKKLGIEDIPCIVADDLSDEQVKAYRLADNKVSELAGWDFTALATELSEIPNIEMGRFGFDDIDELSFPENLDDDSECPTEIAAKLTFKNFDDYETWESELKQIANQAGAIFSCVKA